MKKIQSLNDVEWLKAANEVPMELIQSIEQDCLGLYEASNEEVDVLDFRLKDYESILILETGDNLFEVIDDPMMLEFVERSNEGRIEYYRMLKRIEHEFQLIYSLVGIHDEETESFLKEQAE